MASKESRGMVRRAVACRVLWGAVGVALWGAAHAQRLPQDEQPCHVIHELQLNGPEAQRFAWVLDHLNGVDGLNSPLPRCLGEQGIGVLAQRAQAALSEQGFVTSRVMVEPQNLAQGRLVFTLIPGRIRHIRYADPRAASAPSWRAAWSARPGDVLNLRDIEQALDNFNRVPSADVDIRIESAGSSNDSDLVIRWRQPRPLRLNLSLDDSGTHGTGRYQASATLSLDNPFGLNDLLNLGTQGDLGGGDPGRRGTHGNALHYSLPWGKYLLALDLNEHSYLQSVAGLSQDYVYRGRSASQTLIVSRLLNRNVLHTTTLQWQGFARQSRNFIDDTEIEVQRRQVGGWQLGVEHRALVNRGTLDLGLHVRRGTGALGALAAPEEAFGEGTSRFALVQGDARWQFPFRLGARAWHYSGQWRGQINRTPLSPQERFAIGGRTSVRGFDGEYNLSAERGWFLRNELATPLGTSGHGAFIGLDHGEVSGPSADFLVGKRLTGAVLGLRGGVGPAQYEVFAGWPLHKPEGFRTAHMTVGFWLAASF
ncbi:ShlB/FhaC/HecB family hemolysin secretion/activation protein [Hydrogenophaga sp. BPS33]|uniref:ShlB/FhaC/HecB family hemolysin secretion/activation protein n=1 Tax=Hydrogenophaga sp. BPS33 TaxID=2651974 RepID=UPI00131F9332|nr:ShlB/FhaC/HecB family hemolysin secretion/activation protein [Hydrogenophaga sp. BPS33]QHE88467.1 ShlB/FhaC/HecB family hemolysin secretion/activation protein [Hydrogenophaga sp. BPS33]